MKVQIGLLCQATIDSLSKARVLNSSNRNLEDSSFQWKCKTLQMTLTIASLFVLRELAIVLNWQGLVRGLIQSVDLPACASSSSIYFQPIDCRRPCGEVDLASIQYRVSHVDPKSSNATKSKQSIILFKLPGSRRELHICNPTSR